MLGKQNEVERERQREKEEEEERARDTESVGGRERFIEWDRENVRELIMARAGRVKEYVGEVK